MASPVTVQGIKDRLVGLGPWLDAAANLPAPYAYTDAKIAGVIPAMVRDFERKSRIRTSLTQFSTNPSGAYPATPAVPLVEEDPSDYYVDAAAAYFRVSLKNRPVQKLQRVAVYAGDQLIYEIPTNWLSLKKREGVLFTIPTYGSLMVNAGITAFAQLSVAFGSYDYIPNALHLDYVAGLPAGWETSDEYADVLRALQEYCAYAVLNDIAHLADAGLSAFSASGGGGGQSLSYTRFADRKAELLQSVTQFCDEIKEQESPILFGFV